VNPTPSPAHDPDDLALTCDEVEALLPLVADGSLDETSDPALFAHIARCCPCQDSLARHDLVGLALEHNAAEAQAKGRSGDRHIRFGLFRHPAVASACAAGLALAVGGGWYAEQYAERHGREARLNDQLAALPTGNPVADSGTTMWNEPKTVIFSPDAPGAAIPDLPTSFSASLPGQRSTAVAFDPTAIPAGTAIMPRHFIIIHTGQGPDEVLVAPDAIDGQRVQGRRSLPVTYQRY
jgi:hypothetical protein